MESVEEGQGGYPEEQPPEVADDQSGQGNGPREAADTDDAERAPDNEEGTATGNPGAAGASE